ncbi:MAG TPA: DUF4304 domain-containing protein [Myxococcaceae bacterium]|jgi:hypothetical protein
MTVREALSAALAVTVTGLAKAHGFRKKAFAFRRSHGQTTQAIHFQLSHGNLSQEGAFYVNIGLSFDAVTALGGSTTGQLVIAGEAMQFAAQLDELAPGAPAVWEITEQTDIPSLGAQLGEVLAPVLDRLDAIDSPASMLREFPLDEGTQRVLRAQFHYIAGDFGAALAELRQVAAEFSDRRGMSVEDLIAWHGLRELSRLG